MIYDACLADSDSSNAYMARFKAADNSYFKWDDNDSSGTDLGLSGFLIYPNPTNNCLNVAFEDERSGNALILNQMGQIVYQMRFEESRALVLKLDMGPGVYYLTLKSAGESINESFVIVH